MKMVRLFNQISDINYFYSFKAEMITSGVEDYAFG
jgi:hypothetical protein